MPKIARLLLVLLLAATLSACGRREKLARQAILRGRLAFLRDDHAQALAEFEWAVKVLPDDHELRMLMAQTCLRMGDYGGAMRHAKYLVEKDPGDARAASQLGLALQHAAKNEAGIDDAQRMRYLAEADSIVIKLMVRDEAGAYFVRAHIEAGKGDYRKALEALEKAVERNPQFMDARIALANVSLALAHSVKPEERKRLREEAMEHYRFVADTDKTKAFQAHVGMARVALESGDLPTAEEQTMELLKLRPKDPGATYLLAECRLRQARYEETLALCKDAEDQSINAFTSGVAGIAHLQLGNYEGAEEHLMKAVRVNPSPRMYYMLGYALEKMGSRTRSMVAYSTALERNPNYAAARLALARAYVLEEKWVEAQRELRRLVAEGDAEAVGDLPGEEQEVYQDAKRLAMYVEFTKAGKRVADLEKSLDAVKKDTRGGPFWAIQTSAIKFKLGKPREALATLMAGTRDHPDDVRLWLALGKALMSQAHIANGLRALGRAEVLAPRSPLVNRARAQAFARLGRRDLAAAEYRRALQKAPDDIVTKREYAGLYVRANSGRALRLFLDIHRKHPGSIVDALNLAGAYVTAGRIGEAMALAEGMAEKHPMDMRVRAFLVVLAKRLNRPGHAEKHLAQMIQINWKHVPGYELCLLQVARSDYQQAADLLTQLLEKSPAAAGQAHLWIQLSVAHEGLGRVPEALESLYRVRFLSEKMDRYDDQQRTRTLFWRHATAVHVAQGEVDRARVMVEDAAHVVSTRMVAKRMAESVDDLTKHNEQAAEMSLLRRKSLVLQSGGWAGLAETQAQALVDLAPDSAPSRLMLGGIQLARGRLDAAEKTFRILVAAQPSARAYASLGDIAYRRRDFKQMEDLYKKALALDPSIENAYLRLGLVAENTGDPRAATEWYKAAIDNVPESHRAYNQIACLFAKYEKGRANALALAKRARKLAPKDPSVADTLGWAHYLNGDHEKAIELLDEASLKLPRSATVWYHLAKTLAATGHVDDAVRAYRSVLVLSPRSNHAREAREYMRNPPKKGVGRPEGVPEKAPAVPASG